MNNKLVILEKKRSQVPEILKQNNLIECSFEELGKWSEIHHDLLNELIAVAQHYDFKGGLFEEMNQRIYVKRATLEKNMRIKRKSNSEIFDTLKKMRDTSFTIKGVYQENGYKTTTAMAFFDKVFLHEKPGKDTYFELEYTELFSLLCSKEYSLTYGNYSKLNLLKIIDLKSKYAKALYEILEANKYKETVFTLNEKQLKDQLRYNVKHYRFAGMIREVEKVYDIVKAKIEFKYLVHKTEKSISFKIII
ncbi:RepB family plasmid replication initiator protein [Aliarcobacter butzleri]|jgi:hypothetical protein|uniref:RepB family plasmid replication initiator protein n=1 Tax=Aliarcobacter butzleri TaxID=28197 RepID=UPI0021B33CF6|nr:RepB family plasmid replication initiator protein [Aliarcobacter butzleri]UXC30504.1 RepB family plasmid replication initiator protein [Aliarcobacter butzleri]